jgi:hypothetical protein
MSVPTDWNAWPAPAEDVPVPPPGPGVRAPFASPPTERDRKRMWIGLSVGAALLVLCCGGGIVGFGGLVVARTRALPREAVAVVDQYLSGLRDGDYKQAYDQLCGQRRAQESLAGFTARQRDLPGLDEYTIGQPRILGSEVVVRAQIERGGGIRTEEFGLIEDQEAGGLRICTGG